MIKMIKVISVPVSIASAATVIHLDRNDSEVLDHS